MIVSADRGFPVSPLPTTDDTAWRQAVETARQPPSSAPPSTPGSPPPSNPGVPEPLGPGAVDLQYWGGPLLSNPKIYNVYVGSFFKTPTGQKQIGYNDGFARQFDTASSSISGVLKQYNVGPSTFGGSTVVAESSPLGVKSVSMVTDTDIQSYVKKALDSGALPYDPQGIYNVVVPPNVVITSGDGLISTKGLGGYHSSFLREVTQPARVVSRFVTPTTVMQPVYYSATVDPHTTSSGQQQGLTNLNDVIKDPLQIRTVGESHEFAETMTDPNVDNFPVSQESPNDPTGILGWDDYSFSTGSSQEIGDLAGESLPTQQVSQIDSAGYREQLMWSNLDKKYEIAETIQPKPPGFSVLHPSTWAGWWPGNW
jgi:hypothetical protein